MLLQNPILIKYRKHLMLISNFTQIWSLGWEDPLEKETATHSNILAWKIQGWRNLAGYGPWGHKESDMTERLHSPLKACTSQSALYSIQPEADMQRSASPWLCHSSKLCTLTGSQAGMSTSSRAHHHCWPSGRWESPFPPPLSPHSGSGLGSGLSGRDVEGAGGDIK